MLNKLPDAKKDWEFSCWELIQPLLKLLNEENSEVVWLISIFVSINFFSSLFIARTIKLHLKEIAEIHGLL